MPRSAPGVDIGRNSNWNPAAVAKKTDWAYNPVGAVTALVDPRGIRTLYSVNELDQTWMSVYAQNCDASQMGGFDPAVAEVFKPEWAFEYVENFKDDDNGNLLQRVYKNADVLPGNEDGGEFKHCWETNYQYDRQDRVVFTSQELSNQDNPADTTYDYDAGGNVVDVHDAIGNDTHYEYDARHKVSSITVGHNATEALTTTISYTPNGRISSRARGTGTTAGQDVYLYDGFDRVDRHYNPVGNETQVVHDPASNITSIERWGRQGGGGALLALVGPRLHRRGDEARTD